MNIRAIATSILCGIFTTVAFGKTVYVSPEGAGDKDGTSLENAATLSLLRSNFGSWFKSDEENVVQLLDSDTPYSVPNDDTVFDFNNGNTKYVVFQGNVEDPSKVVLDMSTDTKGNRGYVVRAPGKLRGITFKNFTQKGTSYPGVICAFVAFDSGVFCVENCRFENCVTTATSGEQSSGPVVRHYNNNASSSTSTLIMSNCVFMSCSARNRGIIWKGYEGGKMELVGCTFTNCTTFTGAGSIIYWNATGSETCNLSLKNCRILDVHGTGTLGTTESGAIDLYKGNLSLEDCEFNTVSNSYNGGCVYVQDTASNLSVERCVFRKCTATNAGGAIFAKPSSGTSVTVRNSLFTGCGVIDKTSGASCIYTAGSPTVTIDNCTFADNCASTGGSSANVSPLGQGDNSSCVHLVKNCVFWNNRDGNGNIRVTRNASRTEFSKCVADVSGLTGVTQISASPFVDAENGDYSLAKKVDDGNGGRVANPCLGAGVKLDWMTADSKDLAGNPRLREGDLVDLGCYEYFAKYGMQILIR